MSEFLIAMKKESRDKNIDGQLIEIQATSRHRQVFCLEIEPYDKKLYE